MKVRKILREKLRQDWHGPETIESIARRHRLSESTVRKAWADLRRDGLLPLDARPHFVVVTTHIPVAPAVPADPLPDYEVDDALDREIARSEVHAERFLRLPDDDPALAAMREHHPGMDAFHFNTMPAAILDWETRKPGRIPTPAELRAMARGHDAFMRKALPAIE